jgi:hypothetical protein
VSSIRLSLVLAACGFALSGCARPPEVAPPSTGSSGGVRLEIQYNAVCALARRGSDALKDPNVQDKLAEMLDEGQQLQNFRVRLKDGREVPDLAEARTTVESALKAIVECHRRRKDIDLSQLYPAIEKLTQSENPVIKQEALRTKIALGLP